MVVINENEGGEGKNPLLSKTNWTNLATGVSSLLIPEVQNIIMAHPQISLLLLVVANLVLRTQTNQGLDWSGLFKSLKGKFKSQK